VRELDGVLCGEMLANFLSGADAVPGGLPSEDILLIGRDRTNRGDSLNCLIVKSVSQKLHIPIFSIRDPEVRSCRRKWICGDWQK